MFCIFGNEYVEYSIFKLITVTLHFCSVQNRIVSFLLLVLECHSSYVWRWRHAHSHLFWARVHCWLPFCSLACSGFNSARYTLHDNNSNNANPTILLIDKIVREQKLMIHRIENANFLIILKYIFDIKKFPTSPTISLKKNMYIHIFDTRISVIYLFSDKLFMKSSLHEYFFPSYLAFACIYENRIPGRIEEGSHCSPNYIFFLLFFFPGSLRAMTHMKKQSAIGKLKGINEHWIAVLNVWKIRK